MESWGWIGGLALLEVSFIISLYLEIRTNQIKIHSN